MDTWGFESLLARQMNISIQSNYPPQKLYVLIKPFHEMWNKEKFIENEDVKLVTGISQISYAYGCDWIWKEGDEYHVGYELEPRYWNKDYEHVLVRKSTNGFNDSFYKELIKVLQKPD